jgi:hypothetical protein
MGSKFKGVDPVSDDRNWRSHIHNELNSAKLWQEDWGFLATTEGPVNDSIPERIRKLEERTRAVENDRFRTTASRYGTGSSLEFYRVKEHNICRNPELRPCDRKAPPRSKK